jgi:hypothetical protein
MMSEETGETAPDNERREKKPRGKTRKPKAKKSKQGKGEFDFLNRKAM